MSRPGPRASDPILTPAVVAAVVFVVAAGAVAITFVGARGGLALPVAATPSPMTAVAPSSSATLAAATSRPSSVSSAAPTATASRDPGPSPTAVAATPGPTLPPASPAPPSTGPVDPLTALPGCPGHPGCFEYTVRTGDSYTAVNDRYGLLLWITDALNPEVADKGIIVVGQTLYLGRDPEARLDPCPAGADCRLYTSRSGDTLARIAGRFGITVAGIEALNPSLDPNAFGPGTVIRLPRYQG